MTIHQIMERLQKNIKPYEEYVVDDEVMQAMNSISNAEELFYNKGYQELLIDSVINTPTPHNIWMLHRCYNDKKDTRHNIYKKIVMNLRNSDTTPIEVKKRIDFFDWE